MPGSWEIAFDSVLSCTLTREHVTTAWASNFRNLIIPKGMPCFISGLPFAEARDNGCAKLMELGFEWLFFLDDDVLCPHDTILRLMSHKKKIISGVYYRRNSPIVPVMLRDVPTGGRQWVTDYKIPDLMQVDYVGAGCLLIHRDVLKNLPPIGIYNRWFEWRVSQANRPEQERLSEDFAFCQHARQHGFEIWVDTSIQAKHAGICASEMTPTGGRLEPLTVH
jgi:hypothetical protein